MAISKVINNKNDTINNNKNMINECEKEQKNQREACGFMGSHFVYDHSTIICFCCISGNTINAFITQSSKKMEGDVLVLENVK